MKDLINATCILAKQELTFRGNDERVSSSKRGIYVERLHGFAEKDERLARHLDTSTVFSGLSNRTQNNLIEAILSIEAERFFKVKENKEDFYKKGVGLHRDGRDITLPTFQDAQIVPTNF